MTENWMTNQVTHKPPISFGREVCGDLASGMRREWLVTNGLGGYASSTVAGVNTRRYHGLLVAALTPPVGRTVLVGGMVEWAIYQGRRYPLCAHEYGDGVLDPHGYQHLQSFSLEGLLPVWTFAAGAALLERRLWMAYGSNTTYVTYRLLRAAHSLGLELTPLVTYRDFHTLTSGRGWQPQVEAQSQGIQVCAWEGAVPFRLMADSGWFTPGGTWYWNFRYREESARGLDDHGDLYAPGVFTASLQPGDKFTLMLSAEETVEIDSNRALDAAGKRQSALLRLAEVEHAHPVVQQLTLAADQFIVERREGGEAGKTVIAGYHWFNDWGRDTMISLPGLTLATGRAEDAAHILRTFARYITNGLLPNNFPDSSGAIPGYNTVDATLWYVLAVYAYQEATNDTTLVDELLPALCDIAEHHIQGTRYHIGVDPADGLLHAGESGIQLTWMDAKVGDYVVTPRTGKPVEINALWYNVLRVVATFLAARHDARATHYNALAGHARDSFRARFIQPNYAHLADVIDGPEGDDFTLRPNQIFAVSLPFPLLDGTQADRVVEAVGSELLTSYGLRSLAPSDPAYRGDYGGSPVRRDFGYHEGPVWTWLIGAYAEAYARIHDDPEAGLALLYPFAHHLCDAGLGSISEILEGDPPHLPRGCIAQAWGVAEVLRVWRKLDSRMKDEG